MYSINKLSFSILFFFLALQVVFTQSKEETETEPEPHLCGFGMDHHTPSRFSVHGTTWDCRYITYIFLNGTNDITGSLEEDAVERALASWSTVTNLDFVEVCSRADADIVIAWETHSHGDPLMFDGPGGIVAHAFPPPPGSFWTFDGDVHFDDHETWAVNGTNIDLETVALHEIGHALGLGHSGLNNPVMIPSFPFGYIQHELQQDDIDGIQSLYGTRTDGILGNDQVCDEPEDFVLEDFQCLDNNVNLSWVTSNNIEIIQAQDNGTVYVEQSGPGGWGFISAVLSNNCGFSKTLTKQVWVGVPDFDLDIEDNLLCIGDFTLAFVVPISPTFAQNINWSFSGAVSGNGNSVKALVRAIGEGMGYICASITSPCGTTEKCVQVEVKGCGKSPEIKSDEVDKFTITNASPDDYMLNVYPIPAINSITTNIHELINNEFSSSGILSIIDMNGNVIYKSSSVKEISTVNISNYASGIYLMEYRTDDEVLRTKFIRH